MSTGPAITHRGAALGGSLAERPLAAGVAGALTIAFSAILVRLSHASPSSAAFFRCLYALPPLAWLAWREQRQHGPRSRAELGLSLVAGAFFAADLIFWHHAIADVGAGLATVLGNLQLVFVAMVAWLLLGERPERRLFAAAPLVLAGVVLISGVVGAGAYGRDPARGAIFGLATGITYAGFILALRHGQRDLRRPAAPLFEATAAATVFCLIAGLAVGDIELAPSWPGHGWLVTLALSSQVLGWLLISISLPRLPAAATSLLLTLQPVGSVLLGMVLLGESPSAEQLLGVAVIVAGVAYANLGPRRPAPAPAAPEPVAITRPG